MIVAHYKALRRLLETHLNETPRYHDRDQRRYGVDWYNAQYENINTEDAVSYPMIYIEFVQPIAWQSLGDEQEAECTINLHLVDTSLTDCPEHILNKSDHLSRKIHGERLFSEGVGWMSHPLVSGEMNMPTFDNVKVVVLSLETTLVRNMREGRQEITPRFTIGEPTETKPVE